MKRIIFLVIFCRMLCYAQQSDTLDIEYHWLDNFNTNTLTHKSTTYPTKEDYYASEKYPQFKFLRDNHKSKRWLVYSTSYELLAASLPTNYDYCYESFGEDIMNSLVKYDYEHNAYNINNESEAVRKYVSYTVENGRSIESKLSSLEMAQSFLDKLLVNMKKWRAAGKMTQAAYNKQLKDYNTETAKNRKEIAALRKMLPTKATIERADNYISQLRQDNEAFVTGDFTATRIDGLTVLLQSASKGLKIEQTGYFDKKGNAVEWKYVVVEKGNQ